MKVILFPSDGSPVEVKENIVKIEEVADDVVFTNAASVDTSYPKGRLAKTELV